MTAEKGRTPSPEKRSSVLLCECSCGKTWCAGRRLAHGTEATYRRGCACGSCVDAHNKAVQARHKSANDASITKANRRGKQWTTAEMEVATRADLTAREVGALLGRSIFAVRMIRSKCRNDPKYVAALGTPRDSSPLIAPARGTSDKDHSHGGAE